MRNWCRKYFYWLHLHLGLWAGVLFVLLGLTGSLLTFYPEIDYLLNPSTKPRTTAVNAISVQKVYEVLRREYPERTGSWRIEIPMAADSAIAARYYKPAETADKTFAPIMVTIDPVTYQITSSRFWGSYAVTWIYDLHYTLLLDESGHNAVGIIGMLMLISLILGYWLWMPKWGNIARHLKPTIRSQRVKKIYDLHMILGVYGGVLIAILSLTGVVLAFPNASKSMATSLLNFEPPMPVFVDLLKAQQLEANLDELVLHSAKVLPQSELRWIETSGADGRAVTLSLMNGDEPIRRFPQTYLKFHPVTGQVLHQRDYHQLPNGDKLWAWVHPLHNGEAFGFVGRLVATMLGLIPAALLVTGLIRYLDKRKARSLIKAKNAQRL
jgi:uncharacterized iron-regulated membrane protein